MKDINAGPGGSSPNALANMNGTLFFLADDGVSGHELWKSDGTAAGTVLVKDIRPGPLGSSSGGELTVLNGAFYFLADDGTHGLELWSSNGTEAGTGMVLDFGYENTGGGFGQIVNANGKLFFSTADRNHGPERAKGAELYWSDGTAGGTALVKDLYDGTNGSNSSIVATVNGTVFFEGQEESGRYGMWKSDGTVAGTEFVKDINPALGSPDIVTLPNLNANANGTFFFTGNDGKTGFELWKSDGTTAGTVLVKDINPGAGSSGLNSFTFMNGTAYFRATDGTTGIELWKSDGTEAGTVLVKEINYYGSSNPGYFTVLNGKLYFEANDGNARGALWQTDGTEAGTVLVSGVDPVGNVSTGYAKANGRLYFLGIEDTHGAELWSSDGTTAGTALVADISPGASYSQPLFVTVVGDTLFFVADDGTNGSELWKLDIAARPVSPGTGTAGTILEIRGAGFGGSKGRVEMSVAPAKVPKKLVLKVLDWSDTVIHASVPGGFGTPVTCDVTVIPKGPARQVLRSEFEYAAPEITGASPSPSPVPWVGNQTITVTGQAFGTVRGSVTASWSDGRRTVNKRCKVLAWPTTAAGGGDGPGDVGIRLPKSFKWAPTGTMLTLRNKVGSTAWTVQ